MLYLYHSVSNVFSQNFKTNYFFAECPSDVIVPPLTFTVDTVIEEGLLLSGTSITLSCKGFYSLSDSALDTNECLPNGKWQRAFPTCVPSILISKLNNIQVNHIGLIRKIFYFKLQIAERRSQLTTEIT